MPPSGAWCIDQRFIYRSEWKGVFGSATVLSSPNFTTEVLRSSQARWPYPVRRLPAVQAATLEVRPASLVASEDHGDAPRISDKEAVILALLHLDTGGSHPLAHRGEIGRVLEYDCPVAQTRPPRRGR
jgi:hypothetical protein